MNSKMKKMKMKKMNVGMVAALMAVGTITFSACKKEKNEAPKNTKDALVGSITGVRTLDASIDYALTGPVIVEDGAVLNIPAGTVIKANKGFNNYILVLQGGKININGTAEKPVIITADSDQATAGHWGGLIINGKAPLSGGTIGSTEVSSAHQYGGTNPNDNSGTIQYLILKYTGARSSADVEHNGLTLNGVGNGTIIENVFIPDASDDGIEFFGGTVNVKNIFVVNSDDDMFDFTQGYAGTVENAYGIWEVGHTSSESDPRGVEADGNLDGNFPTHTGQSNFSIKNITIDLRLAASTDANASNVADKMQDVIKVRRGAKANITNGLVKGSGTVVDIIDFKDGKGNGDASSIVYMTNQLSTAILGLDINPATGFPEGKIQSGNTGCAPSVFSWTKYNF